MKNEAPTVLLDHAHGEPALAIDELSATDVVPVLAAILAVVGALVVEPDLRFVVPHVDERLGQSVADPDLGSRGWQAVLDEEESQTCFARRLGPSVHQRKRNPSAPDAAGTSI